jgi:hypothetical protein
MLTTAITINRFLVGYCWKLVADIAEERLAEQPVGGVNHPAWILGHLAFSAERANSMLGAANALPPGWPAQFGPGSRPTSNRGEYPAKAELLSVVEQSFERLRRLAGDASPEQLARPSTNPYTKEALPTIKDGVAFLLTGHLGVHLGQLSMWRRLIGIAPLF